MTECQKNECCKNAENAIDAENSLGLRFNKETLSVEIGIKSEERMLHLSLKLAETMELLNGLVGIMDEAREFLYDQEKAVDVSETEEK